MKKRRVSGRRASKPQRDDPLVDLEEARSIRDDLGEDPKVSSANTAQKRMLALQKRARRWDAEQSLQVLSEVAAAVAANLDLQSLVKQILDTAIQALGADRGIVFLGSGAESELLPAVMVSMTGEEIDDLQLVSRTILQHGHLGASVITPDATRDERLRDIPSIQLNQIRSVLCVPMITRGEALGAIYVDAPTTRRAFSRHGLRFLEVFASIAATAIENARLHGEILRENVRLQRTALSHDAFSSLPTRDPRVKTVMDKAALAAEVETPLLIHGEQGTGKELLARSVHRASQRALGPFIVCNCKALPPDLAAAFIFGCTRANPARGLRTMPGLLRQADRGVLYLDEVGALDHELQHKLASFLQEGFLRPLGSRQPVPIDVRLISASGRNLQAAVDAGDLLDRLYYKINAIELAIPPLRERPQDISGLFAHFVEKHTARSARRRTPPVTTEAVALLEAHEWPGNMRELEDLTQRVLALAGRRRLDAMHVRACLPGAIAVLDVASMKPGGRSGSGRGRRRGAARRTGDRQAIRDALTRSDGNRVKAARLLGVHRNTLRRWMQKLQMSDHLA